MHLLFIDESGSLVPIGKQSPEDRFVLGGIIISEDTWFKIDADLKVLRRKYKIEKEIKWRYFYTSRNKETSLSHLGDELKEQLRTDIYSIISRYKSIKIISVLADVAQCYGQSYINSDDDLYWFAYKRLMERFQYYLEGLFIVPSHFSTGIQLADMVAGGIYRWYAKSDGRFHKQIAGRIRRSPGGKTEGYGIVKLH